MKKLLLVGVVLGVLGLVVMPAMAHGGWGAGPGAFMNSLSEEDYAKWLEDQVENGWLTQKQADYMLEKFKRRNLEWTEEEFNAWVDQQLKDGWITEKQAEYLKEHYNIYKERPGSWGPFMRSGGFWGCFGWPTDQKRFNVYTRWGHGSGMMGRGWRW
ncbi:hypothetical protein BBF96_03870 [Anoxybacter fermentans]|uniref:DUF2680 domain-containing protein n=1 Tax=Anoxybacter fermentans TaxID=1323375 RepID=A0A3Q9HPM7_9FIRM|nr:hypothetical protein [Anoxybacter fermentans]AZR72598.1 hypothetical protein BBF96_03870 [Anoxybacter fermentans]